MVLSFNKLQTILSENGIVVKKIFCIKDECVFLELLCITNANCFIMYIPSKYSISPPNNFNNIYELTFVDLDKNKNIALEYGINPDDIELENQYEDIDLENKNIDENKLNENYDHPLSLVDVKAKELKQIKEVVRQLDRLKLCTKNIKYNLSIIFSNYICYNTRDDITECYIIEGYNKNNNKKLLVTIDLNNFFKKIETFIYDIITIRDGIYKILDKNQQKNVKNLQKLLNDKKDFISHSEIIYENKKKYLKYLNKLENMLEKINSKEKKILSQIYELREINDNNNNGGVKGMHDDVEFSHKISKLEKEIDNISFIKKDIITNILEVKDKLENISLNTDSIIFDVSIMTNTIFENYNSLKNLVN